MKRKVIAGILSLLMAASLMTGCGGSTAPAEAPAEPAAESAVVEAAGSETTPAEPAETAVESVSEGIAAADGDISRIDNLREPVCRNAVHADITGPENNIEVIEDSIFAERDSEPGLIDRHYAASENTHRLLRNCKYAVCKYRIRLKLLVARVFNALKAGAFFGNNAYGTCPKIQLD